MKNITLEMACSINGLIASEDGNEDFLSYRGWEILNYNPFVLSKGIPLFKGDYFESKLKLEKVVKEKDDIIQVHYSVIK